MNRINFLQVLELGIRLNIFLKLMNYGIGKILNGQFYLKDKLPEAIANIPLNQVDGYTLAWTFFGYSKGYILFIGISQIIGACLFIYNRTKIIGGLILLPILLNIIVVDYFYGVAYGALFSAIFYLGGILWILGRNWQRIQKAILELLIKFSDSFNKINWKLYLLGVVVFIVVFIIEYYGITLFGYEDRVM